MFSELDLVSALANSPTLFESMFSDLDLDASLDHVQNKRDVQEILDSFRTLDPMLASNEVVAPAYGSQ
jgi:hypothetical protein